jgi:DNA-binding transcriptional ArsR family regulator
MDKIFKALASEPRRRILHHLMAMPSMSKHLAILKEAGLVRDQKRGQYMLYTLATEQLTGQLYGFLAPFCADAAALAEARRGKRSRN